MNTAIIVALIPYLVPEIIVVLVYVYHIVAVHIPAQQRTYVERWATVAVAYVEQKSAGISDEEKKQLAMVKIKGFFKAFNLPIPPDDVLSSFIEAAVQALDKATPVTVVRQSALQGGSIDPGFTKDPFRGQSK